MADAQHTLALYSPTSPCLHRGCIAIVSLSKTCVLSTVLVLGIGEEDKGTELLHIGRTQFILWFPSEETGLVLNNIICVSAWRCLEEKQSIILKDAENFPYLNFPLYSLQFLFLFSACLEQLTLPVNFTILTEFWVNAKCCLDGL